MSRSKLLVIGSSVYCGCLIVSNILSAKTATVFGINLACGIVVFPIVYILNDVLTEVFGYKNARMVVFTGFAVNLIAVIAYSVAIAMPPSPFFEGQEAFETILGSTPRLLLASLVSYLVGSLVNARIMAGMKKKYPDHLMARCVVSTLAGEYLDGLLFIGIAFIGTMPILDLLFLIIAQSTAKTLYEIVVYPVTRIVIKWAEKQPVQELTEAA